MSANATVTESEWIERAARLPEFAEARAELMQTALDLALTDSISERQMFENRLRGQLARMRAKVMVQ